MTPSPEIIIRARLRYKAGEFKRKILSRKPLELFWDTAILECGHESLVGFDGLIGKEESTNCMRCFDKWIDEQKKQAKESQP
jgi:hypothetical protein